MKGVRYLDSPVGRWLLEAEEEGISCLIKTRAELEPLPEACDGSPAVKALLDRAEAELAEYFAGERRTIDLPLVLHGTPFQKRCWEALLSIPYGETRTYGQQAEAIGKPKASRAVGGANHHNPVSIIVPCHRVIGADGSLTGYGGGMEVKRFLLELEGAMPK